MRQADAMRSSRVVLYRRGLDARSGAGQLIDMQAAGLEAAGVRVRVTCRHGALKFMLRTGRRAYYVRRADAETVRGSADCILVDHGMELPGADIVFVHGLLTAAAQHVERSDWADGVEREQRFFAALPSGTPVVANSELIKSALVQRLGLAAERVAVVYPGFRSQRFSTGRTPALRKRARRLLGLSEQAPLVGLVTSGDFRTRGLDVFLEAAAAISSERRDVRFLIVGEKRLPDWAARHPLVTEGRVLYRPKSGRPELWMAALTLFLHTARFEGFGMVVTEARALGIPVLTSRRAGAAECLPEAYRPWIAASPDAAELAAKASALLADASQRARLVEAGLEPVGLHDEHAYARESARIIGALG